MLPWMPGERNRERCELVEQLAPALHGEGRDSADVPQVPGIVVETEQQRAEERPVDVQPKARDDAVGGALGLDLDHPAGAGLVAKISALDDHTIDPATGRAVEPAGGGGLVGRRRRELDPAVRGREDLL